MIFQSLAVTGHKIGGPPLCYQKCGACLAKWEKAVPFKMEYESQSNLLVSFLCLDIIIRRGDERICRQMGLRVCKRGGAFGILYHGADVFSVIFICKSKLYDFFSSD